MENDFPLSKRLSDSSDYKYVFSDAKRYGDKALTLLVRKNPAQDHARLGLAISKKCAKRAVDRNRVKRLIRESFRLHDQDLPVIDIVVMCRPAVLALDNAALLKALDKQWLYIIKKMKTNNHG